MKLVQNEDIAWQEYNGEAVLVDTAGSICRVLNETASFFWKICEQPVLREEILAQMAAAYEVDPEELSLDIQEITAEFLKNKLIKEV